MSTYAEFYRRSIDDRDAFWAEQARLIDWKQAPRTICDNSKPPFTRWFAGGTTNLCHNAVDRHLQTRPDQPALIYVSTETGAERTYSFRELHGDGVPRVRERLAHRDAPLVLVAVVRRPPDAVVDLDLHLRQVEFQVGVGVHELPALEGLPHELVRHLVGPREDAQVVQALRRARGSGRSRSAWGSGCRCNRRSHAATRLPQPSQKRAPAVTAAKSVIRPSETR